MLLIKQGRQESLQTGRANAQRAYIKQQEVRASRQMMQALNAERRSSPIKTTHNTFLLQNREKGAEISDL